MFYRYGGSFIGTMTETNKWVMAYQSPKLEFVVNQDCWWGSETKFADIILPACTNLERDDIAEFGSPAVIHHMAAAVAITGSSFARRNVSNHSMNPSLTTIYSPFSPKDLVLKMILPMEAKR